MKTEPALTTGVITAFVTALLALLVSFGVHITNDQQAAVLGIIAVTAPFLVGLAVRPKVVPLAKVDPAPETGPQL